MTGYRGRPEASARQSARRRFRALQKSQGYLTCWRCGRVMPWPTPFHTGHIVAHMDGGAGGGNFAPECPPCNLRDGGKRAARITNAKRQTNPEGRGGYTSPWKRVMDSFKIARHTTPVGPTSCARGGLDHLVGADNMVVGGLIRG